MGIYYFRHVDEHFISIARNMDIFIPNTFFSWVSDVWLDSDIVEVPN